MSGSEIIPVLERLITGIGAKILELLLGRDKPGDSTDTSEDGEDRLHPQSEEIIRQIGENADSVDEIKRVLSGLKITKGDDTIAFNWDMF